MHMIMASHHISLTTKQAVAPVRQSVPSCASFDRYHQSQPDVLYQSNKNLRMRCHLASCML